LGALLYFVVMKCYFQDFVCNKAGLIVFILCTFIYKLLHYTYIDIDEIITVLYFIVLDCLVIMYRFVIMYLAEG
jgi:hypothetical protein